MAHPSQSERAARVDRARDEAGGGWQRPRLLARSGLAGKCFETISVCYRACASPLGQLPRLLTPSSTTSSSSSLASTTHLNRHDAEPNTSLEAFQSSPRLPPAPLATVPLLHILPLPPYPSTSSSYAATHPPAKPDGHALAIHDLTTVSYTPDLAARLGWVRDRPREARRSETEGRVNVEVGVAGWGKRVGQGGSSEGGLRRGGKGRRTTELAAAVEKRFETVLLLHLYPRSSIDIYLQILENDGAVSQPAVYATYPALISAGLPLADYVYSSRSPPAFPFLSSARSRSIPSTFVTPAAAPNNPNDLTTGDSGSSAILDLLPADETGCQTSRSAPSLEVAESGRVGSNDLEAGLDVGCFDERLK
ncbi:Exosome complex component ski6 [Rhodotorula toruloides]|nr:Exosome complex component ski6 [Rhodotorula toruloides]